MKIHAASIAVWLLCLAGCTPPHTSWLRQTDIALPMAVNLKSVPFFPQAEFYCGPAALATSMQHAGVSTHPDALAPLVYVPARNGALQIELAAIARTHGLLAYQITANLTHLLTEVAAGHPVLVLQNLGLSMLPQWHYAVVVGFDRNAEIIILRSGTAREHRNSFTTFERTWARAGHWGLVLLPPDQIPATAEPNNFLRAALELAHSNQSQAAGRAFRRAALHWPQRAATSLALANHQYAQGALHTAVKTLRKGLLHNPNAGVLWNNYAHMLGEQGCGAAARAASQCSLALQPDNQTFNTTYDSLAKISAGSCPIITSCPVP